MSQGNVIRLDEPGVIVVRYVGDQTLETAMRVSDQVHALAAKLRQRGAPVLILVDLETLGASTADARRAAKETIDSLPDARIGVHSGSPVTKHLAKFIIFASRRDRDVRYLDDEDDAREWLLSAEVVA